MREATLTRSGHGRKDKGNGGPQVVGKPVHHRTRLVRARSPSATCTPCPPEQVTTAVGGDVCVPGGPHHRGQGAGREDDDGHDAGHGGAVHRRRRRRRRQRPEVASSTWPLPTRRAISSWRWRAYSRAAKVVLGNMACSWVGASARPS